MNWLKRIFTPKPNSSTTRKFDEFIEEKVLENGTVLYKTTPKHGLVDGKHYTDWVDSIKRFKQEGMHAEAIELLKKTVDATERESKKFGKGHGVAPWYYEQLAIIYRKEKMYAEEVEILERYLSQELALGAGSEKLKNRLVKARELLRK